MKYNKLDTNKLFVDVPKTFGTLLFMGFDSEGQRRDENGQLTGEIINRRYNMFSLRQGEVIRVAIPPEIGEKTFKMREEVTLIDCRSTTIVDASGYRPDGTNFIVAADIVRAGEENKGNVNKANPTNPPQPNKENK